MVKIKYAKWDEIIFIDTDDEDEDVKELNQDANIYLGYTFKGEYIERELNMFKGFLCDGASVPFIAEWILHPWYDETEKNIPMIVHDFAFVFGGDNCDKCLMSFEEANELFKALLDYCGTTTNNIQNRAIYIAVDSFIGESCYSTTNEYDKHNYNYLDWS